MDTITLRIEKLVQGGWGLGRTDNGIVFVSGCLPGETVVAQRTGSRGGTPQARTLDIIEMSPVRRTPFCPLAGSCGGCGWQHIDYAAQVRFKKEIADECFRRIGKIEEAPSWRLFSAGEKAYRWRVRFKVDYN
ncbi:MAG: hypothetical protein PHC61_15395, partial [Chitinivibrionales bacterium]|nr:hypothetical protein [Chitinivibrionales bacterium]